MVSYGPWVQGADFERAAHNPAQGAVVIASGVEGGELYYNPTGVNYVEASSIANSATHAAQSAALRQGAAQLATMTRLNLDVGNSALGWRARALGDYRAGTVLLIPSLAQPGVTLPQGAIGVEWEADECIAVGAVWGFSVDHQWSVTSGVSARPATAWLTVSVSQAHIESFFTTYTAPYSIGAGGFMVGHAGVTMPPPANLTPYVRPDGKFLASLRFDPLGFDAVNGRTSQQALATLDLSILPTWTLRPPRHRFVYEGEPPKRGLPPLRQSPRDDRYASAARIWPVSSQQGSNRQHGYY